MSDRYFIALLGFTLLRELYFHWQMRQLIDRLMCRDLRDYKMVQKIGEKPEKVRIPMDPGDAEDLGALQGIG